MKRLLGALLALLVLLALAHDAEGRARGRRLFGDGMGMGGFTTSVVVDNQLRPLWVFTYGQSNSIGSAGGGLPVSIVDGSPTAPPYRAQEYRTNTFVPAYSNTGAANTEIVCYGSMNQLSYASLDDGVPTLAAACQTGGVGSQSYAQLAPGTGNWNNQWAEADGMVSGFGEEFPTASGPPLVLVVWLQGESDQVLGTTRAQYVLNLRALHADVCAELGTAPFNLSYCPEIYLVPYGAATRLGTGSITNGEHSEVVIAHYEACRDYPTQFVCAHPGYASAYTAVNEHYSGAGHRMNGAQIGRVFRHREVLDDGWTMLRPQAGAIACAGNVVTVPLVGGVGTGLAIDTTAVAPRPHLGFEYFDTQTSMPTILTATVSTSAGAAVLTLDRNCVAGAGARVRYAYSGVPDASSGSSAQGGTGGNVRRRGAGEASYWGGEYLYDWLTPFDEPVSTFTAAPIDMPPVVSDSGMGVRSTASTGWSTTRSTTVANGTANMTVSAWVYVTGFAANQVIVEAWQGTNARKWSVRTDTTGRLGFFLSANGSAVSYTCTTANSAVATSAWAHVAFTKAGTTFTPFVNGAAITCAGTTGSVPATLATTAWTGISVSNSSAGGGNLQGLVAHVAVWGTVALDATRIAALYDSTPVPTPVDVRAQNPSHYWPLQGSLGDYGLAAPRPLLPYATSHQLVHTATLFGTSDSLATFGTTNLLDGAVAFTARLDVTATTPSQAGTYLDRDTAGSNQRQIHIGTTAGRQLVVRLASSLTEGGGEWPADGARDECVTGALTAAARYRVAVVYDGAGATNATRLRVYTAQVTEATQGDGRTRAVIGAVTQQTCTFLGTIPAALTSPTTAAWTVGRRASGTTSTGLRSQQLNGDAIVLWPGSVASAAAQVPEVLAAIDPYATSLGPPAAIWRAKGANIHEVVAQGAGTMTGLGLGQQFVPPVQVRDGTASSDGTWSTVGRITPTAAGTQYVVSEGVLSRYDTARTFVGVDGASADTDATTAWAPRLRHSNTNPGEGVTLGWDVADPGSQVFTFAAGLEVHASVGRFNSGMPAGSAGGLMLTPGLGSFNTVVLPNTWVIGVTNGADPTPAADLDCMVMDAAGAIAQRQRLVGARATDDRLDITVYVPPGGGRVTAVVRNAQTTAVQSCTLTTGLPAVGLGLIAFNGLGSSGGVDVIVGPMVYGRGAAPGVTTPRMPGAFAASADATYPWLSQIPDADLRAFFREQIEAPASQWDWGMGPDGAGGIAGLYGTTAMAPTGLPWWSLAPSITNATDATYGQHIRLVSGTTPDTPAMLVAIPPLVTGTDARLLRRSRGFVVGVRTRRSNTVDGRGVVLGVGAGDFGDPAAEVSTFPGVAFEYDATDAIGTGIYLHHGAAVGGTTRVSLAAAGGTRTGGEVYDALIGARRGGPAFGVALYRVDTGQLVYSGWLATNIPAIDAGLFAETNAAPCDDGGGPCNVQTHDIWRFFGRTRDVSSSVN